MYLKINVLFSAQDPNPLDPQHFGILDPDPQKVQKQRGIYIKFHHFDQFDKFQHTKKKK